MSLNRIRTWAALGLLVLLMATPGLAEGPEGLQLFAPAELSTFDGIPQPNEGYFFQFDVLYWNISAPATTPIGFPGLTRKVYYGPSETDSVIQSNTLDTGDFNAYFSTGNRIEFGRVEDGNGWLASIWQLRDQGEDYYYGQENIVFNDVPFGNGQKLLEGPVGTDSSGNPVIRDLPVTFYNVLLSHSVDTWGGELMYLHRFLTGHNGGTFELFLGARYLEFNDTFRFLAGDAGELPITPPTNGVTSQTGISNPTPGTTLSVPTTIIPSTPSFLAGSVWQAAAENHIVGPQIGLRWFKQQGRWSLSSEGRFMAGFNLQNIHENVTLGPNLDPGTGAFFEPSVMGPTSNSYNAFTCVFSPTAELRLDAKYQITRYLNFRVGYTALWLTNIARGDSSIDYTVNGGTGQMMGIDLSRNNEGVFINGANMGFEFNR